MCPKCYCKVIWANVKVRRRELSYTPGNIFFAFSDYIAVKWFVLNTLFDFSKGYGQTGWWFSFSSTLLGTKIGLRDQEASSHFLSVSVLSSMGLCVSLSFCFCLFFLFCFGNPTVLQEFKANSEYLIFLKKILTSSRWISLYLGVWSDLVISVWTPVLKMGDGECLHNSFYYLA